MNRNQLQPFYLPESIPNQPRTTRKCTHQQLNFMPLSSMPISFNFTTIFFNKQSMTTMFSAAVDKLSPCTYVTLAIFFILVFVVKTKPRRSSGSHKLPPGPKPWPFVGCLPELVRNKPTFRWIHGLMKEMKTEILCVNLAQTHLIVISSPEISREVLKTQDANFASRPSTAATRIITRGYLATALVPLGHQWRKMRKIMTSELLSPARMRWTYGKRVEELNHIVRYVHDQAKSPVDIRSLARGYMVNVIRRLVFGRRDFGGPKGSGLMGPQEVEHAEALFTIHAHLFAFCVGDYTPFLSSLDLEGHKKAIRDANATVDKYHDPIIHARVAQIRNGSHTEADDLLHLLIMLKDAKGLPLLSLEEIKAQVTDLMLASVDNPASSVEWAFAELINKPELLKKAVGEIDRVVGKDGLVEETHISKLNYLKACLKEAIRLHPVAPFNVPHLCISDTTLSSGYFIPKGSHVLLTRLGLGRNPRTWADPLRFHPERHLNDNVTDLPLADPEVNMLSFSAGRRGCVGVTLGTTLTVMIMARLIQAFDWKLPPGVQAVCLKESKLDLYPELPLLAFATPRLPANLLM